jgi:hypothetical protein
VHPKKIAVTAHPSVRLFAFVGPGTLITALCACAAVSGLTAYAEATCPNGCEDATSEASRDVAVNDAPHADGQAIDDAAEDTFSPTEAEAADASTDVGAETGVDGSRSDGGTVTNDGGDAGGSDAGDGALPICAAPTGLDGGLLVYYPFEGNATDRSGNGNNGTAATGADVSYTPGKVGQGVTILSGGHGVKVTGSTSLSGAKTLCAWMDPATGTTGQAMPVLVAGAGGAVNYYDVEPAGSPTAGGCTVSANSLFMDNGACSPTALKVTPGSWTFVCFAYGGASTTFFANGSVQTVPGGQYDPYTLSEIAIGSNPIGGSTTQALFKDQLDEVSIWSGALSAADMNALYNGGLGCRIR